MVEETRKNPVERRSAIREAIERRVVFSGVRGEGLLRQGTAVDISASGLLIHTPQPDLVGRHLEVELHAGNAVAPGNVIMVRAEVAWVKPLPEPGEYAMGVRFLQSVPATDATGAGYRPAGRDESARMAESLRRTLDGTGPGVRLELSDAAVRQSRAARERVGAAPERRRRYRWLMWLFLLAIFSALVTLLTMGVLWRLESLKARRVPAEGGSPAAIPAVDTPVTQTESGPSDALPPPEVEAIQEEGAAFFVNRGSHALAQGRFPDAAQAFQTAGRQPGATPVERYIAQLGESEALARSGDVPAALALLESPFDGLALIPASWRTLKEGFRDALLAAPGEVRSRAPMINAFTFEGPPDGLPAGEDGAAAGSDATVADGAAARTDPTATNAPRIEIDTTRYLLTVLQDNAIQAVYPVGLGARDLTPAGVYTIVNKIENPDWYNNGDVVPAGDPENQLGARWLGLADESGPTRLGIHATNDLESIGGSKSRGCIRMRPEDIVALFERIPVGTPVHVRAL